LSRSSASARTVLISDISLSLLTSDIDWLPSYHATRES
jgi:hypothetical protein